MISTASPASISFVRDRITWLGYLLIGYNCYAVAALGPAMPLLREEMGINFTVAAMHLSALSTGGLTAGFLGHRVMKTFGRNRAVWTCAWGIALGFSLILCMHTPALTIFGAFLAGVSGSLMGQTITTINVDRFGSDRAIAITEQNIMGSLSCAAAPLMLGATLRYGIGWRPAIALSLVFFVFLFLFFRTNMSPVAPHETHTTESNLPLPPLYWAYFFVIMLSVASEWSIIFFGSAFLEAVTDLSTPDASQAISFFLIAMLAGRILGRRLLTFMNEQVLLPAASVLAIGGFFLFWLARDPVLNLVGLSIAGLGIANFFPLSYSAAVAAASRMSSKATSRMSIATGTAVLTAPLTIGIVADQKGIFIAYGVVAVLLCLSAIMVLAAIHCAKKTAQAESSV